MIETHNHNQKQLQAAASILNRWMARRVTGEITFHLNGKGGLGERATVHVNETLDKHPLTGGIEVTIPQFVKAASDREAKRATTTTHARTPNEPDGISPSGGTSHVEKL